MDNNCDEPSEAGAAEGAAMVDGPDGVAVTVTPEAAAGNLRSAARLSMFDPNQHVAAATALDAPDVGGGCLGNLAYMHAMLSGEKTNLTFRSPTCGALLDQFYGKQLVPLAGRPNTNVDTMVRAMVFVSEERCNEYVSFLQTYQGNVSTIFGIGSQVASLVGALTTGGTANAFAGIGGTIAGAGSTINKAGFHDKALELIAAGFTKRRARIRDKIDAGLKTTEANYPAAQALNDARDYHTACSLTAGFQELEDAVSKASPSPDDGSKTTGDAGGTAGTGAATGGTDTGTGTRTGTGTGTGTVHHAAVTGNGKRQRTK